MQQAPDIDLIGLTGVFGNVTVDQATRNALVLAEMAGLHIPVAGRGAAAKAGPFPPSHHVHGDEGFGAYPALMPQGKGRRIRRGRFFGQQAAAFRGKSPCVLSGP